MLDKDGTGFELGRAVTNIRPISRDTMRCQAAKAQLLQLSSGVEAKLREANQHGAGTKKHKNGTDQVYHKLNESIDFGSLFFSLGLNEHLTAVKAMRDLSVDSNVIGQGLGDCSREY